MAAETGLDLAQRRGSRELRIEHRNQVPPGGEAPLSVVRTMLAHQGLEAVPPNLPQQTMQHGILMRHGLALPLSANVANVPDEVESMPCTNTSIHRAGQLWVKPGHDGEGSAGEDGATAAP